MNIVKKQYTLEVGDLKYVTRDYPPNSRAKLLTSYPDAEDKFKVEVFYDSDLSSYKGVMFYFAGGSGNWEVPIESPLVDIARNGYLVVNWSAMKSNLSMNVNRFSQWAVHNYTYWGAEVNECLDYFYGKVVDVLFKDKKVDKTGYLYGHSRGAGAISMWGGYSTKDKTPHASHIRGVVASSPAGGVNNQPYVSLRSFTNTLQQAQLPLVVTVGAGDVTHTSRAYVEQVNPIITNAYTSTHVIGGAKNGHNSFNNDYWMWFTYTKPLIDAYYK